MKTRKELKKAGRRSLKRHYVIFTAACLLAAFLGSEFAGSLDFSSAKSDSSASRQTETSQNSTSSVKTDIGPVTWENVLEAIQAGDTEDGRKMAQQIERKEVRESKNGNPMFGRSRGVLSGVVNKITSGSILVTLVAAAASITGSESMGILILVVLGALGAFAFWFFITNVFPVVIRRIFLEGMLYDRVTTDRFIFLLRIKKWCRASWIMFVKYVYYTLWCLTIVGIAVKRYSYYLVPYIAAENPDMTARQAITLSRKMMAGHKWECFVYELSFIGWHILGLITMGIFDLLFTNPYKTAVFTAYYGELRALALERSLPGSELLYDTYLYKKADDALIRAVYPDVLQIMKESGQTRERLTGWRGFLAGHLGILLMRRPQDRIVEKQEAEYVRIRSMIDDVQRQAYPVRLYPIPEEERRKLVQSLNYMRHYSIWSLIAVFFSLSLFGWLWEVGMHLVSYGEFVNRGALHGPWIPIYGTGALLILTLLYRVRKSPALTFILTILLCGFLEYMTSLVMELVSGGIKWWDYSGYFLNLNGRICAEGLLVFGTGGLMIVYVIAPIIDTLLSRISQTRLMAVCMLCMVLFAADVIYSCFHPNIGKGVTDIEESSRLPDTDLTGMSV